MQYFAFGSNMNLKHLRAFLHRFGVEAEGVSDPRRAILSDFRLRTNYLTTSGLGAANIEPCSGDVVEGILLAISENARLALRDKEGFPCRYYETLAEVIVPSNGETILALTYQVTPEHALPCDAPVSPRYRSLILDGAKAAKLSHVYQSHLQRMLRTPMMVDCSPASSRADDIPTESTDYPDQRCA